MYIYMYICIYICVLVLGLFVKQQAQEGMRRSKEDKKPQAFLCKQGCERGNISWLQWWDSLLPTLLVTGHSHTHWLLLL